MVTATLPARTKAEQNWISEGLCLGMDPDGQAFTVTSHNSPKSYRLTAGIFDGAVHVQCSCIKGAIDSNSQRPISGCKHAAGLCRTLEANGMLVFDSGQMTWVASPAVVAAMAAV
jgi:hypothetical protein